MSSPWEVLSYWFPEDDIELEVLADFLRRTANAGRSATDELAAD